jgi:hypothetical protein
MLGGKTEVDAGSRSTPLTTGLKRPPLVRKKVQAVTAKLKPTTKAVYSSCAGVCGFVAVETPRSWFLFEDALAVSMPAKANVRKTIVPRNSPTTAKT